MGRLSVDFPHLLGNAPGMVHSPEIHLLSGEWDMSTLPEDSTPAYVVQGTLGTAAGYSTLTPNPTLTGPVLAAYAVSRDGIPVAGGVDTRWAEMVAHNPAPGDTLLYRGHAFINTSATPGDFFTLLRGGYPANRVWGAYVYYSGTGFDSFQIVDSNVGVAISEVFDTPVSPGDSLYTGINYASHRLVHQHGAEPVKQGALLNLLGMPDDETFYEIVFLVFSTEVVVLGTGSVSFLCGSSTGGRLPIQGSGEAIPPAGATDGREYKVTVGGSYGAYRTLPGDFAKFYNGMQDLQITRLASRFNTPVYTVRDMTYDEDSDVLTLELSDGTRLETTIVVPPGIETMEFDTNTQELTTVFSDGSEIIVVIPAGGGVTGLTYTPESRELRLTQTGGPDVSTLLPAGVETVSHSNDILTITLTDGTELTTDIAAESGFVAIVDVTPTSPSDNVYDKVLSDGGHVLQSCKSSTPNVTVKVVAVTGKNSFMPVVTVNGLSVPLLRLLSSDTWEGSRSVTLTGPVATLTAMHSEGARDTAQVTIEAAPVITSAILTNLYQQMPGLQTQHASGQSMSLQVSADSPFVNLRVVSDGTTATADVPPGAPFAPVTSRSVTVYAVAPPGGIPGNYAAKVQVQDANGSWSSVASTSNLVYLDDTHPSGLFGTKTYDSGYQALKGGETAQVVFSASNADDVVFTSPTSELSIAAALSFTSPKVVTRVSGGYNVSTTNLRASLTRFANATTAVVDTVVNIADTAATVAAFHGSDRLRSGGTNSAVPSYPVVLAASQRLLTSSPPTLSASSGSWVGAFTTANQGVTWTGYLSISDSDTKGPAVFSGLVAFNLAGIPVAGLDTGTETYTVGGFVRRVVTFTVPPLGNAQAAIGTLVTDTSKLSATNLSKGPSGTPNVVYSSIKQPDVIGGPYTYVVVDAAGVPNPGEGYVYSNDSLNAAGNTVPSNPITFEIEEVA